MSNFFLKLASTVSVVTLVAASTGTSLVSAASEFAPYAAALADNGVITAQSTESGYRLGNTITRAELAKVVANLGAYTATECTGDVYSDVGSRLGDLCGYIEALAEAGVVSTSSATYRPSANVTRAEMVKMLLAALGETPSNVAAGYMDLGGLGDLAGYVNRANEIGCASDANYFRPNATSSRGEAFKIAACVAQLDMGTGPVVTPPGTGTGVTPPIVIPPGTGTGVVPAGSLSVSLEGVAMAQYVPSNASSIKVGSIKIMAGTTDVNLNSVTITRSGLGRVSDISTVQLAQSGSVVSDNRSLNQTTQNAIVRLNNTLTLKAGTSVSFDVLVSLSSTSQSNSQHQFAVTAIGANSSSVAGLPVTLGLINTTSYVTSTVNVASITTAGSVTSGKAGIRIANVKIDAGSNRDTTISAFTLSKDTGEDYTKAFANVMVYRNSIKVGMARVTSDKIYVTGLNTLLLAGESADYELRADTIYVGTSSATTFKINDSTDVTALETTTGYATAVTFPGASQSLGLAGVQVTWNKNTTGSKTVAPGTSSVVLFDARVTSDASFDVTNYTLTANSPAVFTGGVAAANFSRLVLSVDGIETDLLSVANPALVTLSTTSDKFRVEPGKIVNVKVTGTLKSNAVANAYRFTVNLVTAKNVTNGNTVALGTSQAGDTVTVMNGKATFKSATIPAPSIKKLTANVSNSEIGRFSILAEAEDITVRKLVFSNYSPAGSVAQVNTLTPTAVNSTTYTVTINGTAVTYVSDSTATVAEITAGLTAAVNASSSLAPLVTAADMTTTVVITSDIAGTPFSISVGANLANVVTTANAGSVIGDLRELISGNSVKLYDADTNVQINASITVAATMITADSISFVVNKDVTKNIRVVVDTTALNNLNGAGNFTLQVNAPTPGDITRQSTGFADLAGSVLATGNPTGQFVAASSTYTAGKMIPTVTLTKIGTDLTRFNVTIQNVDSESGITINALTLKATPGFLNGTTAVTWDGVVCVRNGATGQCGVAGVSTAGQNIATSTGAEFTLAGTIPNLDLVKNNGTVSFDVYLPNLPFFSAGGLTLEVKNLKYDGSVIGEDYTGVGSAKVTATK